MTAAGLRALGVVVLGVMRARLVLALALLVLLAGSVALVDALGEHDRSADDVAAVEPAGAADAAVETELDPLAGITLRTVPADAVAVDTGAPLPVPEDAPANPYEPEPEVRHGTLSIPKIGLSQPLFEGVSLTAINRGPSHWPGTAMPGQLGNVVIAGHRTTYTRPFWDLQALVPGDELIFDMADGSRHVYVLDRLEIVQPTDVHIVDQTYAHTATLFACHPRGSARQRIVGHFTMRTPAAQVQLTDTHQIRAPR